MIRLPPFCLSFPMCAPHDSSANHSSFSESSRAEEVVNLAQSGGGPAELEAKEISPQIYGAWMFGARIIDVTYWCGGQNTTAYDGPLLDFVESSKSPFNHYGYWFSRYFRTEPTDRKGSRKKLKLVNFELTEDDDAPSYNCSFWAHPNEPAIIDYEANYSEYRQACEFESSHLFWDEQYTNPMAKNPKVPMMDIAPAYLNGVYENGATRLLSGAVWALSQKNLGKFYKQKDLFPIIGQQLPRTVSTTFYLPFVSMMYSKGKFWFVYSKKYGIIDVTKQQSIYGDKYDFKEIVNPEISESVITLRRRLIIKGISNISYDTPLYFTYGITLSINSTFAT